MSRIVETRQVGDFLYPDSACCCGMGRLEAGADCHRQWGRSSPKLQSPPFALQLTVFPTLHPQRSLFSIMQSTEHGQSVASTSPRTAFVSVYRDSSQGKRSARGAISRPIRTEPTLLKQPPCDIVTTQQTRRPVWKRVMPFSCHRSPDLDIVCHGDPSRGRGAQSSPHSEVPSTVLSWMPALALILS